MKPKIDRQPEGEVWVDWPVNGLPVSLEFVVESDGQVLFFGLGTERDHNIGGDGLDGCAVPSELANAVRGAVEEQKS